MNTNFFGPNEVESYTLSNGLTVLRCPSAHTMKASVNLSVKAGSLDEPQTEEGIVNLTRMVCGGALDEQGLPYAGRLEDKCGVSNGGTGYAASFAQITIPGIHIDEALRALSGCFVSESWTARQVAQGRKITLATLTRAQQDGAALLERMTSQLLFPNSAAASLPYGYREIVENLTDNKVRECYETYFTPDNTILTLCGSLPSNIDEQIVARFGEWAKGDAAARGTRAALNPAGSVDGRRCIVQNIGETNEAFVELAFPGIGHQDDDGFALLLLLNYLSMGNNSLLRTQLCAQQAVASKVDAKAKFFENTGSVGIRASTTKDNITSFVMALKELLNGLQESPLPESILEPVKERRILSSAIAYEDMSIAASEIASMHLSKKIVSFDEYVQKISQVTPQDIQRVAQQVFSWADVRLAALGSISQAAAEELLRQ